MLPGKFMYVQLSVELGPVNLDQYLPSSFFNNVKQFS
jgi:hypothetical protein